jgi:hypothetical protein
MHIAASIKGRFTFGVGLVLLHYAIWRLAVLLIAYNHDVEGFGADLWFITVSLRWYIFASVCAYSLLRRFVMQKHEWDIYAPPLAFFSAGIIYLEALKYAN